MALVRCITEMGMGVDVHGRDATKAAKRAVSDAIRHSSLGFTKMLGKTAHDMIVDVTIGVPDPDWGEAVKAVVVLRPQSPITGEELLGFCKERLSGYKVPKSVEFRDSLPHTEVGKVNKVKLRDMILAEMTGASSKGDHV